MKGTCAGILKGQIFSFTRFSLLLSILPTVAALISGSCTKINEFTIGQDFVEPQTRLQIVDTFKVDLSTILLDSIVTSNKSLALAGGHSDDQFGSVSSESYFDLAFKSFENLESNAIYDSAAFIFTFSDYNYGDTTEHITIALHQLTEEIEPYSNNNLYNSTSFDFNPLPLGTTQFLPWTNLSDTGITIPVNDFGEDLFGLLMNKDEKVSTEEAFTDYLKGFVLKSTGINDKVVVGFTADKNHLMLRFYYHIDKEIPEMKDLNIEIGNGNHQFNNIRYDFTNTLLEELTIEHKVLKSQETGNAVYIQGLTGLIAKIQFPTLQNLLMEQRWKILKADLVFRPVKTSYNGFRLPEKLSIYETDRENRINTVIRDNDGNALLPEFVYDEFYGEDTRYTFDITGFINSELADKYVDYEHGLMIGLVQDEYLSSLERLVIEGKNPAVKLRIYYLTY